MSKIFHSRYGELELTQDGKTVSFGVCESGNHDACCVCRNRRIHEQKKIQHLTAADGNEAGTGA